MPEEAESAGIVSAEDLAYLTLLFAQFEGALDPFCAECRRAEAQFNAYLKKLFAEKVSPAYESLTFNDFRSYVRVRCRQKIAADDKFSCT